MIQRVIYYLTTSLANDGRIMRSWRSFYSIYGYIVFFPGHFSVAKSHAALPDRHAALFKGKFRHAPFFSKAYFAKRHYR